MEILQAPGTSSHVDCKACSETVLLGEFSYKEFYSL